MFCIGGGAMNKVVKKIKGFTVVELIVVMAIIATLAAIIVPFLMKYVDNARVAKVNTNARHVYSAAMYAVTAHTAGLNSNNIFPNTVYVGNSSDLIGYSSGGGSCDMSNYLGADFTGYFAFVTDASGCGCEYAIWSANPISAASVQQLSAQDVQNNVLTSATGCYPLKEDPSAGP